MHEPISAIARLRAASAAAADRQDDETRSLIELLASKAQQVALTHAQLGAAIESPEVTNPGALQAIQQAASAFQVEMSLFSAMTRKLVAGVETLVKS